MNQYVQIAQDTAWHTASPLGAVVIAVVVIFAGSFGDINELPQGHRASQQQLMHSVSSLVFPTMNVPNSSQHRSVPRGVMSFFSLTPEMGWGLTAFRWDSVMRILSPQKAESQEAAFRLLPIPQQDSPPLIAPPPQPLGCALPVASFPPEIISDSLFTFCLYPHPPDPRLQEGTG